MEKLPRRCKKVGFPVSPGAGARSGRQPPRGLLARIFPEKDVGAVWFVHDARQRFGARMSPDDLLALEYFNGNARVGQLTGYHRARRKGEAKTWTG